MWARVLEAWLTTRLLQSPAFHRVVHNVHKRIREIRHGKDPEDMGGTNIDDPNARGFLDHYLDELKEQFRGGPPSKR